MEEDSPISFYEGFQVGKWKFDYLGKGLFALECETVDNGELVLDVDEEITIPFNFRICRIDFTSDDATSKDISVYVKPEGKTPSNNPQIVNEAANTDLSVVVRLEQEYAYKLGDTIRIVVDGTANKKIYIRITIQMLKGSGSTIGTRTQAESSESYTPIHGKPSGLQTK